MGKLLFKVTHYLLLLITTKDISLVTNYLEDKVTVIILHVILLLKSTQQFPIEEMSNILPFKLALQALRMPMPKMSHE